MTQKYELRSVPRKALTMLAPFELASNGDGAKTAKFSMVARTGEPAQHPYFGWFVNDMAGMQLHKPRITIDYNHDETVGYANRFDTSSGDLIASGVIRSVVPGDAADRIIKRSQPDPENEIEAQPYEASITFDGDIIAEEIPEGYTATVNGRQIVGPMLILRQWNLRAIAICDEGCDKYTSTTVEMSNDTDTLTIKVQMNESHAEGTTDVVPVEATEVAVIEAQAEQIQPETPTVEGTTDVVPVDTVELNQEAGEAVEQPAVEPMPVEPEPVAEVSQDLPVQEPVMMAEATVTLGQKFMVMFGEEQGAKWFALGKSYDECLGEYVAQLKTENTELKARLDALAHVGEPAPVRFAAEVVMTQADQDKADFEARKLTLEKKTTPGIAAFAASITFPKR